MMSPYEIASRETKLVGENWDGAEREREREREKEKEKEKEREYRTGTE